MKKINIVYFDNYNDVDIVCIPNVVYDDIDSIVQKYFIWLSSGKHSYWKTTEDGNKHIECDDALVFVEWINNYIREKEDNAYIVKRNTKYDPQYPVVDF